MVMYDSITNSTLILNTMAETGVELLVNQQALHFETIEDFEFALHGRTSVPTRKVSEIVHLSVEQLNDESITIKNLESYFVEMAADAMRDPDSINQALKETEPLVFSQDHGWRDIIAALNQAKKPLTEYKQLAIAKYLQYLTARQELIQYLYSEKTKPSDNSITDSLTIESNIYEDASSYNSSTLDMVRAYQGRKLNKNMQRLTKGEKILVQVPKDGYIDLVLSKYKCKLVDGGSIHFVDQDENEYPLKNGKNIIGRDSVCSIVLDKTLRDISRVHLVITKKDESSLEITDLSSHGTFLPSSYFTDKETTLHY